MVKLVTGNFFGGDILEKLRSWCEVKAADPQLKEGQVVDLAFIPKEDSLEVKLFSNLKPQDAAFAGFYHQKENNKDSFEKERTGLKRTSIRFGSRSRCHARPGRGLCRSLLGAYSFPIALLEEGDWSGSQAVKI